MKDRKDLLGLFGITRKQVDEFLDLAFLDEKNLTYDRLVSLFNPKNDSLLNALNIMDKEDVDLILMYLALKMSIDLRRPQRLKPSDWRKIKALEQAFLELRKTEGHIPPAVLNIGHVIHEYWAYVDRYGEQSSSEHHQPGTD